MNNFKTEYIINDFDLMPVAGEMPEKDSENVLNLGKYGIFKKDECTSITKRNAEPGVDGALKLTIKAPDTDATVTAVRLAFEIKEVGKNTSEFANALTRNAKSICVETTPDGKPEEIAARLVKLVEAQQKLSGVKLFTISNAANVITITCDAYSEVKNWAVAGIDVDMKFTAYSTEVETSLVEGKPVITHCVNPFGTAEYLIKNFRLPSLANTNWLALNQDERPIPGAKYTQFVIEKTVERNDVHGMGAVGQKVTSVTTHVFFVNNNIVTDFETQLAKLISDEATVVPLYKKKGE